MIRVLHNYGGDNTRERRIEPGEYAADDPRLFGLADYLLANGHAVSITPVMAISTDGDRDTEDAPTERSDKPKPKRK
jgi:hypothetical protein